MIKSLIAVAVLSASCLAQAANESDAFVIAAYGDSTTAGVMSSGGKNIITPGNELAYLQKMLQSKYGSAIEVENHGLPGAQAAALLYRKGQEDTSLWRERMDNSSAKIILLNFAINDARHFFFKDKNAHLESPEEYARLMTELVKEAKAHNKLVVLQEPNPICGKAERWNVWPYVYQLNEVAKAQDVPIVKQWSAIKAQRDWQSGMSPDCIHPSEMLYQQKAQQTFNVISANFDKELSQPGS
ncbi:SGNH/GDSL hydrolase family protein [Kalamiella sp. sgz302252]|uniref:SGNH/GDSL hydrolase family protein n=1 Tax=Pantoea sp. sgz302252 TaxID=3341827 RepID=UPI0036D4109E